MASVSLTGADGVQIDGRNLNDLADGDAVAVVFNEDLAKVKAGKNGNTIYAQNQMGFVSEMTLRVLLGSSDDKYLNSRLAQQIQDFSAFDLVTCAFAKRVGDGAGNLATKVYQGAGGIFQRQIDVKSSAEGDTDQSVAVYRIAFGVMTDVIQ